MLQKFNCPSCGAENSFKSAASLFAVCPYCRSSIFRNENEIELIGKVSELADDNSPLQMGSQGQLDGKTFTVVGRVRMKWEDGFWNEWHLFMGDGSSAWLAEAQGEFVVTRETPFDGSQLNDKSWFLNDTIKVAGNSYTIIDLKDAQVFMAEGELPFRAHQGDKRRSADFRGGTGSMFGSLEQDDTSDNIRAYIGKLVELSQLKMSNLRKFDGW